MEKGWGRSVFAWPNADLSGSDAICVSAWFGLVAGLLEGSLDLTVNHFQAPGILCASVLLDSVSFTALGVAVWLAVRAAGRQLPAGPLLALLSGVLVYGGGRAAGPSEPQWEILLPTCAMAAIGLLLGTRLPRPAIGFARKALPWTAGIAAACLIGIPAQGLWAERRAMAALPAVSAGAPNVLLVIFDTLRADHLSSFGYARPTSPNIDRLASEGVRFDDAVAVSSWTLPSHASMMTGLYPDAHHVEHNRDQIRPGTLTLPWAFRQAGYRTAAFSANRFFFTRRSGMGQGFIRFGDFFFTPADALSQLHYAAETSSALSRLGWERDLLGRQSAADINRAALAWIDSDRRPFFLALNYFDAHDPYLPPAPYRDMFAHRHLPAPALNIGENILPQLTPAEMTIEMDAYDGAIRYADAQLGNLLAELARRGLLDETLLIVTSDHGEAFGEHGLLDHANALYFPLLHVPLIFRWPGRVPAGFRVAPPISTKDIGATALALAGLRQTGLPGRSLDVLWTGAANPAAWPAPISELAEAHFMRAFPNYYGPLESVITPKWQYIVDPRDGALLYDWRNDPAETHNFAGEAIYRATTTRLASEFAAESRLLAPANIARSATSPRQSPAKPAADQ